MLGTAAERFTRTKWRSLQEFAEECYAIFRGDAPIDTTGPVTISPDPGTTAIEIITVPGDPAPPITVNGVPIGGSTTGGQDLNNITWPNINPGDLHLAVPDPADNPITLYGEVVAKIEADTYSVKCWAKDPTQFPPIAILTVQQRLIDPDDEIPVGTPVFVLAFPGFVLGVRTVQKAVMQVPVFLKAATP